MRGVCSKLVNQLSRVSRSWFLVVSAYQTVEKRKLAVFFDLPGKLNVGVLFVKVIVKSECSVRLVVRLVETLTRD